MEMSRHVLGGRGTVQHVVQVAMIEMRVDIVLQRRKLVIVAHEAVGIQFLRRQFDHDDVIVPVQPGPRGATPALPG